jgi:hypothetical protein
MYNLKDFSSSQADRTAQMRHAEQQQAATEAQQPARLGPVFGPALARLGDGLVAAGTRLQARYADLKADSTAAAAPRSFATQD